MDHRTSCRAARALLGIPSPQRMSFMMVMTLRSSALQGGFHSSQQDAIAAYPPHSVAGLEHDWACATRIHDGVPGLSSPHVPEGTRWG